jgi:hypothetical protein
MQLVWKESLIIQFALFNYGERLIHHIISEHVQSHEVHSDVELFVLHFTLCFVKALRWWGMTRITQPHIHMFMFCPHVVSTVPFTIHLKNYKWELSTDTFSCAWTKIHCCFNNYIS